MFRPEVVYLHLQKTYNYNYLALIENANYTMSDA